MKKYIRGKNFVGNYEIRKAIENDPTQPVRKCSSNIAKMNVFEYVYYFFKDWQGFSFICNYFCEIITEFGNGLLKVLQSFVALAIIIFLPITIFIKAYIEIKRATTKLLPKNMLPLALIVEIRIIEILIKCLGMKTSQKK